MIGPGQPGKIIWPPLMKGKTKGDEKEEGGKREDEEVEM